MIIREPVINDLKQHYYNNFVCICKKSIALKLGAELENKKKFI